MHILPTTLIAMALVLSGCAGKQANPTRYYLIDPVEYQQTYSPGSALSISVIDLHIPQYLERFHIATRASESRLVFSESHQWGENLRKNLLRTLARNLSELLATNDVSTPLNRSAASPDFRLQFYIEMFERDADNRVKLFARWQLSMVGEDEPLPMFAMAFIDDKALDNGDYGAMVARMRVLYGQLCEQIAGTIVARKM